MTLKIGIFFSLLLVFSGCGKSPLLHHGEEETLKSSESASAQASAPCALDWGGGLCGQVQWKLGPVVGENTLVLTLNQSLANQSFDFHADMPEHGHGTAPVELTRQNAYAVEISHLWLVMGGRWVLHFVLAGQDRTLEVRL